MFKLLDVAVGPIYAILTVGAILAIAFVAIITYFAWNAIKKIKEERERHE